MAAAAVAIPIGIALTVIAVRALLAATVDTTYDKDEAVRRMHASRAGTTAIVHRDRAALPAGDGVPAVAALARIRQRGTLRVGYDPGNLPFSFFNADGELVGFDIELTENLASALGARAEFVPVTWREVPALVAEGVIDVMPSVWYRPYGFSSVRLSQPYMTGTMGIVVRDERRHEFSNVDLLRQSRGLKIGVPLDTEQISFSIGRYFGDSATELVAVESATPFFEGQRPDLDGFLMPAESGAAATLLYPQYTVVVPQPDPFKIPSAFGLAPEAEELAHTVDEWVVFAMNEGMIRHAYDYWILGQGATDRRPRWSIVRDVLGWVE